MKNWFENVLRKNIKVQLSTIHTTTIAKCAELAMAFESRVQDIVIESKQTKSGGPMKQGKKRRIRFSPVACGASLGGTTSVHQMSVNKEV